MHTTTPRASTTDGGSGAERAETAALLRARFAALHVAEAQRSHAAKERWRHESEVLRNQISAMEETIGLLEREIKLVAAMVAKAEKAEAAAAATGMPAASQSAGKAKSAAAATAMPGSMPGSMPAASRSAGGGSSAADLELLLGKFEDKCLRTHYDLEEARRQFYFPAVSGFSLRLSYGDTYVGFKELVLEELSGTLRLTVVAGMTEDGHMQVPSIRLTFEGGDDSGASLRFLGEGVSVVNRRELFGISLSPNISFTRLDLAARFKADIPLVYLPKRRMWIVDSGFKIELLHFKREASATGGEAEYAPEKLLRMLVQAVVEGITRQLLMGQLGPHLGTYLKDAAHGAAFVLEVCVSGIPVRTFDAPLGGASEASAHAAALLGLSRAQVAQLMAVQRMVALDALPASEGGALANGTALSAASGSLTAAATSPAHTAGAATGAGSAALPFVSFAEAMRHFSGARRVEPLRSELVALWQEALYSLRSEEQPADIELLLERIESLRRKPAQVTLRCIHLRLGVEPEKMLAAATGAIADQLFAISARHGTASAALHTFTEDALSYLAAARATLQRASLSLAGVLRGGGDGRFWLSVPHALYEGGALVSRLMSPAQATPFSVLSSIRDDGRLELIVSLPARRGGADPQDEAQSAPEADALVSTAGVDSPQPASSPLKARAEAEVLRVLVTKAAASILIGSSEIVRASFIPEPAHSPPRPPPLELPPLNLHPRGARESRGARPGPVPDGPRLRMADVVVGEAATSTSVAYGSNAGHSTGGAHSQRCAGATACRAECSSSSFIISPPVGAGAGGRWVDGGSRAMQDGQPHQPLVRTVEAYENERRLTVLRSYSAQDLFPLDYAHFSDEAGKQRWASLAHVTLPGDGWRWVSPWRADIEGGTKNEQGWQFAIHFNTGWLGMSNALTHVRRRRWVRCAEFTPAPRPASPEPEAARPIEAEAASGLDLGEPEGGWTIVDAADVGGVAGRGVGAAAPVDETWASDRARCDAPTPRAEGGDSSRGRASPAAALLQLSIADGASVRITLEGAELSGRPVLLAEQVAAALLEQNLAAHTWFREPLMVALERMKKYLHSPKLHCQGALSVSAASAGGTGSFAVHVDGTGREDSGNGAAAQQQGSRRNCVLVFRNEINLMDFVSDVHDIYEAFTATVTTQSGYTAFDG